jgi:hypothetical protein
MPNPLTRSVTRADDGTWGFQCPGVAGSTCGNPGAPFSSTGWPEKKHATARGRQHFDEHLGHGVTQSLEEFRAAHGLGVDRDGSVVSLEDLR